MKKITIACAGLLALAAASCADKSAQSPVSPELNDSISIYTGKTVGSYVLADYLRFAPENRNQQTKDDIFRGIRLVMGSNPSEATLMGIHIGAQLYNQLNQLRGQGIEIDNATVLRYFKESFDADSLDMNMLRENSIEMNTLVERAQQAIEQAAQAQAAQADGADLAEEAAANLAAGEQFVADCMANDPDLQKAPSGLVYKIVSKGDDTPITDKTLVKIAYEGQLPDGTVFDRGTADQADFAAVSQFVPGFAEGLKKLGKGGRAVFILPPSLAYGETGSGPIGPNQTIVFQVEILDAQQQ